MRILVDRFIYQGLRYVPSRHAVRDQPDAPSHSKIRMKKAHGMESCRLPCRAVSLGIYFQNMITVIIPAHDEARVMGRLLRALVSAARPADLEIIVVANGCTDDTAEVAAQFGSLVRVLAIPIASKYAALKVGDDAARSFPRIYVDADVELRTSDVFALAEALSCPGILAAAPQRKLALEGRPLLVRWQYEIWERLPEYRNGLFGRGVVAVNEAGHARIADLPPVMADDLAASLMFAPHERAIVPSARVVIHTPRTFADVLRHRVRAAVGVAQIARTSRAPRPTARTRPSDLAAITRREPQMTPHIVLFLAVALLARFRAKRAVARGDFSTWLRDESSRQ